MLTHARIDPKTIFRGAIKWDVRFPCVFIDIVVVVVCGVGEMAVPFFCCAKREPAAAAAPVPFVPEERTVTQLMEMGFSREHVLMALRATETNRVEVAMEYLLTHPAPPPGGSYARGTKRTLACTFVFVSICVSSLFVLGGGWGGGSLLIVCICNTLDSCGGC